ncbi:MAG TPA: nucleotidyltransferase domain-containing protein [Geobacterales bacterium]|nr:nucleotidyltransferase domain-containing protein [Geobacterales bacterium]
MDYIDIALEEKKLRENVFKNYLDYIKKIKEIVKKELRDFNIYIFGSVVRGDYNVMLSDIDIAIVTDEKINDIELKIKIEKQIGIIGLFQIHIISKRIWENWYLRFIDKFIEV